MARAYRKPLEGVLRFWCECCEEWHIAYDDWTKTTVYEPDGSYWEWGGTRYWSDYIPWVAHYCDYCNELICPLDETPNTETKTEVWVCGNCNSEYDDAELAAECCLD